MIRLARYGTACSTPFTHSMQLTHENTAIDIDGFTGHEIVFDKKLYRLCDVKGVTIFMEGGVLAKDCQLFGSAHLVVEWGQDHPRRHGVDTDIGRQLFSGVGGRATVTY